MRRVKTTTVPAFFFLLFAAACLFVIGCGSKSPTDKEGKEGKTAEGKTVVLFTTLDDIFSRPFAEEFEQRTGIKVRLVTDMEANKTVGLFNRLLRRKDNPEADVFWNSEISRTLILKKKSALAKYVSPAAADIPAAFRDPDGYWTGFAARARVILYNTKKIKPGDAPRTLADLTKPAFKGQVVLAKPLFGTSSTHAAVLFDVWGPAKAEKWFMALAANDCLVTIGNAAARNLVQDGEVAVCLTDTDDANGALLKNKPVAMVYPNQGKGESGALMIPNTVALIAGAPHPENGKKLIDFLLSKEVEAQLAKGESAQMPVRPGIEPYGPKFDPRKVKWMKVDWERAAARQEEVERFIRNKFLQ